jgi:uncharacterized membrane protein
VNRKIGITIFSLIETGTVIGWQAALAAGQPILAAIILFAGYELEHIVAFNVGRGKPLLSDPDKV